MGNISKVIDKKCQDTLQAQLPEYLAPVSDHILKRCTTMVDKKLDAQLLSSSAHSPLDTITESVHEAAVEKEVADVGAKCNGNEFDCFALLQDLSTAHLNEKIGYILGEAQRGRLAVFIPMENKRMSLRCECLRPLDAVEVGYYKCSATHWRSFCAARLAADHTEYHEAKHEERLSQAVDKQKEDKQTEDRKKSHETQKEKQSSHVDVTEVSKQNEIRKFFDGLDSSPAIQQENEWLLQELLGMGDRDMDSFLNSDDDDATVEYFKGRAGSSADRRHCMT